MVSVVEMPKLSFTMEQGKIAKWLKEEGDEVEKDEPLVEIETDKANVEMVAPMRGFFRKVLVGPDVLVPVSTPIGLIADSMEEDIEVALGRSTAVTSVSEEREEPLSVQAETSLTIRTGKAVRVSPLAMKLAKEHGIDPNLLKGVGDRIVREDVEKAIAEKERMHIPTPPSSVEYEDIELTKMRRVIAQRLSESKRAAPHFYIDMTVDVTNVSLLRANLEKKVEQETGLKLTLTDVLTKLVAQVLKEFPIINASFLGDRIRIYKEVNVGVAVGIEDGLVVPVIRNADQKSIYQVSQDLKELVGKARNKKLLPEEYSGGTFTITNLGMFGVENLHPIINQPESAILGIGCVKQSAVVVDGKIEPRPLMKISLSVDHRVIDGVTGARFLGRIKELIESPQKRMEY